jgi:hypothetical protein
MPVIPATQEIETRGLWFKASLGKVSTRPYLKKNKANKPKSKGLGYDSSGRTLAQKA